MAEVKVRSTRSSALDTFWTLSISGLSTRDARHGIRSDIDICTQSGTLGEVAEGQISSDETRSY